MSALALAPYSHRHGDGPNPGASKRWGSWGEGHTAVERRGRVTMTFGPGRVTVRSFLRGVHGGCEKLW
eukprot:1148688-Rhodomonas_salina.2